MVKDLGRSKTFLNEGSDIIVYPGLAEPTLI